MPFKEFIHRKSTHIVMAIIAINIVMWACWVIFKPARQNFEPAKTSEYKYNEMVRPPALRRTPANITEFRRLQREVDSLKIVAALEEKAKRETAIKDSIANIKSPVENSIQFVFDNWTAIFTIVTAIPVIVLKWEQTIHKIKAMHKKVTGQ